MPIFSSVSFYNQPVWRYKVVENRKCTEWPRVLKCQKYSIYTEYLPPGAHIFFRFTIQPAFLEIQGCRKLQMHQMTSDWPWTLNCQKYLVYTEYLITPRGPNFHPVCCMASHFRDTRLQKLGNALNGLKHLTVKSTLYTLNTNPIGQNFHPFHSTTRRLCDTS